MTVSELTALGLPLDMEDGVTALAVESGLKWIEQNTTFPMDLTKDLPASVKLFLVKYVELFANDCTVSSESLGGMSQSFSYGTQFAYLLRQYASDLLSEWFKGGGSFTPATSRWK